MYDANSIEIILEKLDNFEKRIKSLEGLVLSKPGELTVKKQKELSLKEFILLKKPSEDVEKTLIIGYFLEKYKSMNSFNSRELLTAYESAKEKKPLNINDKVNMCIKRGFMSQAKEKKDNLKAWYITNAGEQYVENLSH
jgi:hypothetical protein